MPPGTIMLRTAKSCLGSWHAGRTEDDKGKIKPKIKETTQASNKKFLICIRRSTERKLANQSEN